MRPSRRVTVTFIRGVTRTISALVVSIFHCGAGQAVLVITYSVCFGNEAVGEYRTWMMESVETSIRMAPDCMVSCTPLGCSRTPVTGFSGIHWAGRRAASASSASERNSVFRINRIVSEGGDASANGFGGSGHPAAALPEMQGGPDFPRSCVSGAAGDVGQLSGLRAKVRAGAGLLSGRDVRELRIVDPAGAGAHTADPDAQRLAVRCVDRGGLCRVSAVRAGGGAFRAGRVDVCRSERGIGSLLIRMLSGWPYDVSIGAAFVAYLPFVPVVARFARVVWMYVDQSFDPR